MKIKLSTGEKLFSLINVAFLTLLMILTIYPFLYVAFASLSSAERLVSHSGMLLRPLGLDFSAYIAVLKNPDIGRGYLNTFIYVFVGTALNLLLTSMAAYGLCKTKAYWSKIVMILIIFTMFFKGGLIPFYLLVKDIGLLDSRLALILPVAVNSWNLIVMRNSFKAIPESMEESAKMDGANDFTVLFRIILPLSMPIISVMLLFYGVQHWNSWFQAMIFLSVRKLFPLQLILREVIINSTTDAMTVGSNSMEAQSISQTIKYATILVATIPILLVYPFVQKYFMSGIMIGAIKE